MRWALLAIAAGCAGNAAAVDDRSGAEIARTTWKVTSDPGIEIAVHELAPHRPSRSPVLLVHGAGLGAACFDLPIAGYSLAEDIARAGHTTYMVDIRGWGASTWPPELARDPIEHEPSVTSEEAVHDIAAAVDEIRRRNGGKPVAIVGWAVGGHWAGMYAARNTAAVDRLVLLNTLYGTRAPWALNDVLEDSPGRFSAQIGAYALRDGMSLIGRWEASIPGDKDAWRDPRVAEAYVAAALASDPTAREPSGPLRDSHAAANGVMMWVASAIAAPVLVVRGERDFWSRPEDVAALKRDLHRSRDARFLSIPEATHFLIFDRPEHGRAKFVEETLAFLAAK